VQPRGGSIAAVIASIEGEIESVDDGHVHVRVGDVVYELLVPAVDLMRLSASVGERTRFHTLHYLENQGNGASYWPRLIGFATPSDRAFFELFTTVKGVGNKKALRALQLPIPVVAEAIANADKSTLQTLPEIGKKMAETIIHELKDKVNRYLGANAIVEAKPSDAPNARIANEATLILVQLGEQRATARALVERTLKADSSIATTDELVSGALRLRELG
jgi:Holliday junction DNA helicase RuvA